MSQSKIRTCRSDAVYEVYERYANFPEFVYLLNALYFNAHRRRYTKYTNFSAHTHLIIYTHKFSGKTMTRTRARKVKKIFVYFVYFVYRMLQTITNQR